MSSLDKLQFDNLLTALVERGASDLYLTMGSRPVFRIVDSLVPASEEILTAVKIEELILPLINAEQKEILVKEKALVFSHTFETGLRFKINIFYAQGSLAADFRFIPSRLPALQELGLPNSVGRILDLKSGLVIIAGPVDSGKSTTLASLIQTFNLNKELRIMTLEKPVEFIFTNAKSIIQQREVGKDTPSFEEGLEDLLETSADIVAVSAVENKESMERILNLTEQGNLVLLEVGANSVVEVILEIISFFEHDEQERIREILSRVLQIVVCQKLIAKREGGLALVPEILFKTDPVRVLIADGKINQLNNILKTSVREGMVLFDRALAEKVRSGEISQVKALEYVMDKDNFKSVTS